MVDLEYSDRPTTQEDELCYGVCRSCGMRICRPYNVGQRGMHAAVICDDCFLHAALAYQCKETNMHEIARQFGIAPQTVRSKFARLGIKDATAFRKNARRANHTEGARMRRSISTLAYRKTARGIEQLRDKNHRGYIKHQERNKEYSRQYYSQNKQRAAEYKREYYKRNRQRILEQAREYRLHKVKEREFANGVNTA